MSLRERREPVDELDILVRHSLRTRVARKSPSPEVRDQLMRRAGEHHGRLSWRLPFTLKGVFSGADRFTYRTPQNQLIYVEALFGPRLNWFTYNHMMR
jgi:hypothetical protein